MAKVIGPLHSTEARGVIGGLIYNTWRGIRNIKRMTSPAQPRTQRSLQIRAWTIRLVRAWQSLSAGNQGLWNDYAAAHPLIDWTGIAKRITGANWYVALGLRLLDMGKSLVSTPPLTVAPDPPEAFAAANGAGSSVLTWTATAGTDKTLDYWVYGPHSPGLRAKIQRAKHYKYCAGESGTDTFTPGTTGLFTFFARMLDEDNGLSSTWVSDTATIS